jgi:hypothetical protein
MNTHHAWILTPAGGLPFLNLPRWRAVLHELFRWPGWLCSTAAKAVGASSSRYEATNSTESSKKMRCFQLLREWKASRPLRTSWDVPGCSGSSWNGFGPSSRINLHASTCAGNLP